VLTDKDKAIESTSASALTFTVPTEASVAFPVGTVITVVQAAAGQLTIAGAGGVTVYGTPGLKLRAQWSTAQLVKRSANVWYLSGDLAA
jgi:hypothetical protein